MLPVVTGGITGSVVLSQDESTKPIERMNNNESILFIRFFPFFDDYFLFKLNDKFFLSTVIVNVPDKFFKSAESFPE